MNGDVTQTVVSWILAVLLYPGLLFALVLALVGEWLLDLARPVLTPRLYRVRSRPRQFLQPLFDSLKLAGRSDAELGLPEAGTPPGYSPLRNPYSALLLAFPVLALALMPFAGNPVGGNSLLPGDLLTLLLLLAVYPLGRALLRLKSGGLAALAGAREIGRLLTGLLPVLIAVAALVEVSGGRLLVLSDLTAAPETAAQTFVRLIAAAALIVAFSWWVGRWRESEGAGSYAGGLLQSAALSAFWAVLVLPAPGNLAWGIVVDVLGALFAYVAMRVVAWRWVPVRRERDAAGLVWATAAPLALLALVIALWSAV